MSDKEITDLIDKELKEKTLGVTEQYLKIHSPVYLDGKLKIERIDREKENGIVIAYLPVDGEVFFFKVYIDTHNKEIFNINTEPYNRVYFRASSETLSLAELKSMCNLIATDGRNKGDLKGITKKAEYKYSYVTYLPNPEPDDFSCKLKKLLDYLEQDKEGIKWFVEEANGYIQVAMNIHNANGMIGGPSINRETIKRMSDLGLGIDFDLYLEGKSFLDDVL
ncbi:DUF4279 domain-containing protein [Pedobacter metabolipauper]|uniref:Uncharacterized protein DUF4279 n=1 Tax=Pedobacter metabolipauper TaxID=425513 RepID=A0A4R6SXQ1_9SPHI|nr:DUF4279 domain-containing protein [Pedobacter metabolipauper]TDQ09482.1 uncharacterized protein DUF4279 [Pedobacter metabolipauper]